MSLVHLHGHLLLMGLGSVMKVPRSGVTASERQPGASITAFTFVSTLLLPSVSILLTWRGLKLVLMPLRCQGRTGACVGWFLATCPLVYFPHSRYGARPGGVKACFYLYICHTGERPGGRLLGIFVACVFLHYQHQEGASCALFRWWELAEFPIRF